MERTFRAGSIAPKKLVRSSTVQLLGVRHALPESGIDSVPEQLLSRPIMHLKNEHRQGFQEGRKTMHGA